MKYLTRTVWILSIISLLNDVSSEMLTPIMPLFLQSIGFSTVLIGILEGFAEATAGLSKGYFGRLSDSMGKRLPFVQLGYGLSALAKPMMAIFSFPFGVFSARSLDKLGKGLRTAARDALLSDEATPQNKGKVFGFHRALDTTGAAIGPAVALFFLMYYPGQYKTLFLISFIPAMAGLLLTFLISEKKHGADFQKTSFRLSQMFDYLKTAPANYRKLIFILLLFAIFNSSDIFLLLKIKESGMSDEFVIGAYIFFNLIYALAAFPLGHLADKFGLKNTLAVGLLIFAAVYAGFGFSISPVGFIILYAMYGVYMAATEGIAKAFVSNMVSRKETASAIGTFAGLSSLAALVSSSLAGLIWNYVSPEAVFIFSACGVTLAAILLITWKPEKQAGQ